MLGGIAGYVLVCLFDTNQESEPEQRQQATSEQGNGFQFSLLVLMAHVIQADGKIMHSEMQLVRNFLRDVFGEYAETQGNEILRKLFEYRKQCDDNIWNREIIMASCRELTDTMPEEHRIQLIAFLVEIAKADGEVCEAEIMAIRILATNLRLDATVVDQMFARDRDPLEESYKVLGDSANATDEEVRQAYRELVIKHHPDRFACLGDNIKEAATRKLQEINKAKELIYEARNMK